MTLDLNTSGATFGTGRFNQAFTGGTPPSVASFPLPGTFTAECWVQTTAAALQVAIGNSPAGSIDPWRFYLGTDGNGYAHANIGRNNTDIVGTTVINDGKPHHLALVATPSGSTLYVDGSQQATGNGTGGSYNDTLTIGALGGTSFSFAGFVDEVRISNTARYASNFTPSSAAFTADSSSIALYHLDGNGTNSAVVPTISGATPSGVTGDTVGVNVVLAGVGFTNATFSISGGCGAVIKSQTIQSDTAATLVLNVGAAGYGAVTIASSAGGSTTLTVAPPNLGALNIGWIGDSITFGTNGNPVGAAVAYLGARGYTVSSDNQAISGTAATVDWVVGGSTLSSAISSFKSAGVTLVVLALGTNDFRTPNNATVAGYVAAMRGIVRALVTAGFQVMINHPIWSMPNKDFGNGDVWAPDCNASYRAAWPQLAAMADGRTVFIGDTGGFSWSARDITVLGDGIHPANATDNTILGEYWAAAIINRYAATPPRWSYA